MLAFIISHARYGLEYLLESFFIDISYFLAICSQPGIIMGIILLLVGSKRSQRKISGDSESGRSRRLVKTGLSFLIISIVFLIYFIVIFNLLLSDVI
jgi:hypothetical protein